MTNRANDMTHFSATTADISRIWTVLGGAPQLLDREPTAEEISVLALGRCQLGRRYRKTVRCPVNGDGYWYFRRELLDESGSMVGSVVVPYTGGEL